MAKKWIYYRIYGRPTQNWYEKLLAEVVKPFAEIHREETECIWFNCYHQAYRNTHDEDCERKFRDEDDVRYIRFRILADEKRIPELKNDLEKLLRNSDTFLEKEECIFDGDGVLTRIFGVERMKLSIKYLDICGQVVLSLLTQNHELSSREKIEFMHYFHNMLKMGDMIIPNMLRIGDRTFPNNSIITFPV